ncbi:MAG: cysteine--tRNA ligase [Promethearchaeota archaeon]
MITIFDDLANEYREFRPVREGFVNMYVCGITAYDSPHIGHARSAVAFDVIRRYFEFHGYEVKFVMNYTDIDDHMINRAKERSATIYEIAEKYIKEYEFMQQALRIKAPTVRPRATEEIPEMVEMIKLLDEKGFAYESGGSVYFDTSKMEGYKVLFRKKDKFVETEVETEKESEDGVESGAESENSYSQSDFAQDKRNVEDFVLWKKEKPGEPSWDSPWGKGRPGWHIECSVMAQKHLGKTIDIHGGGKDLKQPHHQNEIAQSECANDQKFVNYWMHNGFLNIDNEKMSKSLGNFIPLMEMLEKFSGTLLRYYFATSYYKRPMDFSMLKLEEAKKNLEKIQGFYSHLTTNLELQNLEPFSEEDAFHREQKAEFSTFTNAFLEAMDHDFNSAKAFGHVFAMINYFQKKVLNVEKPMVEDVHDALIAFLEDIDYIFQFILPAETEEVTGGEWKDYMDHMVDQILQFRKRLKLEKNYEMADRLRDLLAENGVTVNDKGNDYTWEYT